MSLAVFPCFTSFKESPMRKSLFGKSAAVLLTASLAAGAALAHGCPREMKAIDDKLATKPAMSKDVADKVTKLRADGEAAHKAGKHDDSMKALAEAKKLLGM
jgi:hypothetical protein